MSGADQIKGFIVERLAAGAGKKGIAPADARDELNMLDAGLVDSLAFLSLLADIEARFGITLDLSASDPAEFLTVGGLSRLVAGAISQNRT